MGLTPEVMGKDAHNYAWAKEYSNMATRTEGGMHA